MNKGQGKFNIFIYNQFNKSSKCFKIPEREIKFFKFKNLFIVIINKCIYFVFAREIKIFKKNAKKEKFLEAIEYNFLNPYALRGRDIIPTKICIKEF